MKKIISICVMVFAMNFFANGQSNKYFEIYDWDFNVSIRESDPIYNDENSLFYDISLSFRNISNKTIKSVLFDLSFYDINGNLLFDYYSSNTFGLIRPNETSDEEIYIVHCFEDLKSQIYSLKVTKVSIIFEDYTFVSVNEDITFTVSNYLRY